MDPNLSSFPILSYVMTKFPSISPRRGTDSFEYDLEQPPPRSDPSTSKGPYFELTERMPHLTDPNLIESMRSAVSDVARTRSILHRLGERPDHESIDIAKAKIDDVDSAMMAKLEDIVMAPPPAGVDQRQWRLFQDKKEEDCRKAADKEKQMFKAVISLDEMHDSYGKLLKQSEQKLEKIYEAAAAGRDIDETSSENPSLTAQEDNVIEEVMAILQDAFKRNIDMLDLSGRRIRLLPEVFGRISSLLMLNLSSNQLEAIPDSIAGLEHLQALNLSSNNLESLPDSIGFLVNLRTLDVSSNKLFALPDSIEYCRSLVELDASFNQLTYLPTNMGCRMQELQRLAVQLNKIRSLPTSIGDLQSLCFLDLHFNELRGLPESIGRLRKLETLNLSSNFSDLTELPDTIVELANLKELDLRNNQIRELPLEFGRLERLTRLYLDENPIVVPPMEIVHQGAGAVKEYMIKRSVDVKLDVEMKSEMEAKEQEMQTGWPWLSRRASWLNSFVTAVSAGGSAGHMESMAKGREDTTYLNKPL